jgi:hypothetical protein
MGEPAPVDASVDSQVHERHRKTYQVLLVIAVCLAVVGAPMLMEGAAALAKTFSQDSAQPHATAYSFFRFAVAAAPMILAAYTWTRVKGLQRVLEQEEQQTHPHR